MNKITSFAPQLMFLFLALLFVFSSWQLTYIQQETQQPVALQEVEYATSQSCQMCHPGQYESWHQTYHRTMTQTPSAQTVLGDFNNASYTYQGITSRFTTENGQYFMETAAAEEDDGHSPDGYKPAPLTRYQIAFTVGSRRLQQYVTQIEGRHVRLPLAWNIEEERWIHLNGGFLDPEETPFNQHLALWDANCIFCHNVKAQPGYDVQYQTFDSQVAELGIACEACHGPAAEHIARNQNPLRRYFLYTSDRDPTIYSPHELPQLQQIQLCGHCHGQRVPNPSDRIMEFMTEGDPYTAGDDLNQYTTPIFRDTMIGEVSMAPRFWANGTPRLSAYEYQGLLLSEKHMGTELTCTSCHIAHGGDPKGMIEEEMRSNGACLQCHTELTADVSAHTKHQIGGDGNSCYACHMPDTTYGLLRIHPSHHITSPDPSQAWQFNMPNACTVCHTNQTAQWAAEQVNQQYNLSLATIPPAGEQFALAETIRTLLMGDVVQRAVAIHALTDEVSYTSVPEAQLWVVPFLLLAMEDDYPSLRFMAYRGLRDFTGQLGYPMPAQWVAFDYLAPAGDRQIALEAGWQWWQELDKNTLVHPGPAVPLDEQFNLNLTVITPLLALRANETISIGE